MTSSTLFNLTGVWHTVKADIPVMIAPGHHGPVIITSSRGGSGARVHPGTVMRQRGLSADRYFTKYQDSGVMLSVGLCGRTPFRLFATSVRLETPLEAPT